MKFWAFIVWFLFFGLVSLAYKREQNLFGLIVTTFALIGILILMSFRMTWVFTAFSRDFDESAKKCIGWEIDDDSCFGVVQNRY